jgi:hypothetical protein
MVAMHIAGSAMRICHGSDSNSLFLAYFLQSFAWLLMMW